MSPLADISVHQPQISICSGGGFWCTLNIDTVISTVIAMLITLIVGFVVAARLRSGRPGKLQMLFEGILGFARSMTHETVDEEAGFVVPLAVTLAFFILIANWVDFLPLQRPLVPANSDWNLTLAMGLVVFIAIQGYAIKIKGLRRYLQHAPGICFLLSAIIGLILSTGWTGSQVLGLPLPLALGIAVGVLLIWITRLTLTTWSGGPLVRVGKVFGALATGALAAIEDLVKPVTLSLRLFGNILAGVIMVELLAALPIFLSPVLLGVWKFFDVFFIGSIQAFIFMLLTIIYFGMAREGLEEEGHGAPSAAHH